MNNSFTHSVMRKYKLLLLSLIALAGSPAAFAQQQHNVRGTVTTDQNEPLQGVTVLVQGTHIGTVTDKDGQYTIRARQGDVLEFRFVGYQQQLVTVDSRQAINVKLSPTQSQLTQLVVVGYGTQKKENLTGSVSTISGDELMKKPVMRASAALEGLAPGVTVTQGSGQPGADGGTIRVRGIGTLGNSDPLVLIDGIEGTLDGVDPNDIQDISILKDAASASIYGSRAANGVILVTTKRGNNDKIRINYESYFGYQRFTDLQDFADGYTYMTALNQAYRNEGRDPLYSDDYLQAYLQNYKTDPDHYPNVDWQKVVYTGSGFLQHHYIGITGGSKLFKVMGSVAYQDQKGEVPMYESQRYSFRLNTEMDITRNFQVRLNMAGRHSPTLSPTGGTGTYGVISEVIRQPPVYPALLSDGRFGVGWSGTNPPGKSARRRL